MAQQYGKTWWGQKWLQSLNNIDYSNRLPRGASYARKGAVKQIKIEENRIQAKVAGSRPKPYKVDIILPPFFDPELSNFLETVVTKPFIISKLLNRELDPSLLEMAEQAGLKVFPQQWTDFKMQCSCPDWAVPCKHVASVVYKLSEEIDNNPFLVFELHLLDLIAELNKRGLFINTQPVEIPELTRFYFEKRKTLHLTANGAIIPQIVVKPNKQYGIRWLPALISKDVKALTEKLSDILPPDIFWWKTPKSEKCIEKDTASNLLSVFITELVGLLSGETSQDMFQNLFFNNEEYGFQAPGEGASAGGIQTWLHKYYLTQGKFRPQLVVSETINDNFLLQTMATLSDFVPGLEDYINNDSRNPPLGYGYLTAQITTKYTQTKTQPKIKGQSRKIIPKLDHLLSFGLGSSHRKRRTGKAAQTFLLNTNSRHLRCSGLALSGEYEGAKVDMDEELMQLIRELTDVKDVPLPKSIKAELRPYQQRGYSWMYRNSKIGFGSVIADDMGLGKTLQVITTLLKYKEDGLLEDKKALVIAPTGLLTNWQAEIEKFAPSLSTRIFHGANRKIKKDYDILLTSYGIARTEAPNLKKLPWHSVVIDEAQNIKNNDTAQAKAIKSIKADNFIAMSGTPVENRLSELWSIMDYSNRGLLGNVKEFKDDFGTPIETYNDIEVAEKLKKVTAPFMMRRLKSDKSIISDLPDKIEMDTFGTLTTEQAGLYEKTLEEALMAIEAIDPANSKELFARQGLVLQMILALKQICNHPTQFLKNNKLDASLSGKVSLLFDKLDSIIESGEKVLIFTQFREMGDLLQHFIEERYKEKPMFYHGSCSLKQRKEMVHNFQNNPADKIFILSLKAAGTGLNLTAANHVIHYDLWWNPAVEAQATDRAYRIGQKSNVMVHRFITKNTFEERINEIIQSKKALAEMTVSSGENWIGNLSNKELKDLFVMK
ncbi:hypothetical protein FQR65_LT17774 [Abscondita terminalis]|nr:hypothetical protein FQR65_LT17774 [Abscondita terminalis]